MAIELISIGMIGLPSADSEGLLLSLTAHQRMQLVAAFSPRYSALTTYCQSWRIRPFGSAKSISQFEGIHGLIWSSDAGDFAIGSYLEVECNKPVLICMDLLTQLRADRVTSLHKAATRFDIQILPELRHRWTASTLRLRELMVTKLGHVQQIQMTVQKYNAIANSLESAIDWARTLLAIPDVTIEANGNQSIKIKFCRPNSDDVVCQLNLGETDENVSQATPKAKLVCQAGEIIIESDHALRWKTDSGWNEELLDTERSAQCVLLDLFGRRIAGGAVPVPDLREVLRTQRLTNAVRDCLDSGQPVHVDDSASVLPDLGE